MNDKNDKPFLMSFKDISIKLGISEKEVYEAYMSGMRKIRNSKKFKEYFKELKNGKKTKNITKNKS